MSKKEDRIIAITIFVILALVILVLSVLLVYW